MKDFKKRGSFSKGPRAGGFNKGGDRPRFGGGRGGFGAPTEMFQATCNQCKKACEVPFRPNGKKPVYCRDCFVKDEGGAPARDFRGPRPERSYERSERSFDRPQRDFAPRTERPRAFTPPPVSYEDSSVAELKREIITIHTKIDGLTRLIENVLKTEAPATKVAPKKARATKKK